jgi:predicted outer membrane repeat protein
MTWRNSQGRNPGAGLGPGGRRWWARRRGAAGAAVVATAGMAAATATAATAVATIPVPCRTTALAAAINNAPANAILSLKPRCVYRLAASLPQVTSNLTIKGNHAILARSGAAGFTALRDAGVQLIINQLTLTGFKSSSGIRTAALLNNGGTVTITQSRFAHNDGGYGGAILNESNGRLSVAGSSFAFNRADYGGAIANGSGTTQTLADSFHKNTAVQSGGAIWIDGGTVTVGATGASPSTAATFFTDNVATDGDGGAIYNQDGALIANYATFTRNHAADYGGAVAADSGSNSITNSGFTRNHAEFGGALESKATLRLAGDTLSANSAHDGGAIYVYRGTTTLSKTLVFGNRAGGDGGGIYRRAGSVSLANGTLVTLNRPDNCAGFSC